MTGINSDLDVRMSPDMKNFYPKTVYSPQTQAPHINFFNIDNITVASGTK